MNKAEARSLLMDYLYEEISEQDKKQLEAYLEEHPDLQAELDQLRETRSLLQRMPESAPSEKLLMMEPQKRSFSDWWADAKNMIPRSGFGKTVLAAAAGFILVLFLGSLAKLHIEYGDGAMVISLGYTPAIQQGISPQQAELLMQRVRQENAEMLGDYLESVRREHQLQLQQVARYFEDQRLNDLQLIDQNLDRLQLVSDYRWQQTNEFLGEVLQTVGYQEN